SEPTEQPATQAPVEQHPYLTFESMEGGVRVAHCSQDVRRAVIPQTFGDQPVLEIAKGAFRDCAELELVTVPEGVLAIDAKAFDHCELLACVALPLSLERIEADAFVDCPLLTLDAPEESYAHAFALTASIPLYVAVEEATESVEPTPAVTPSEGVPEETAPVATVAPDDALPTDALPTETAPTETAPQTTASVEPQGGEPTVEPTLTGGEPTVEPMPVDGEPTPAVTDPAADLPEADVALLVELPSIVITGATELGAGKVTQLTASVTHAEGMDQRLLWQSDSAAATVDASGKVRATAVKTAETVHITARLMADETILSAPFEMKIYPLVTFVKPSASQLFLNADVPGSTLQLSASCLPETACQTVTWKTSNEALAAVDSATGVVTVNPNGRLGVVTFMATAQDGSGRSGSIQIKVTHALSAIELVGPTEMAAGKSVRLTAVFSPANASNKQILWTIDCDPSIARVSGGVVSAKNVTGNQTVTVTATSVENPQILKTHTITIKPVVTKVTITAPQTFIDIGAEDKTLQLSAACEPEDAADGIL
ncbi:MAG: Ig-like domain-containing protein, partial [Clostridia bacterium]